MNGEYVVVIIVNIENVNLLFNVVKSERFEFAEFYFGLSKEHEPRLWPYYIIDQRKTNYKLDTHHYICWLP